VSNKNELKQYTIR